MTIEIRQLIIRAVVDERSNQAGAPDGMTAPEPLTAPANGAARPPPATPAEDRRTIIAACVREVMRRLERARER